MRNSKLILIVFLLFQTAQAVERIPAGVREKPISVDSYLEEEIQADCMPDATPGNNLEVLNCIEQAWDEHLALPSSSSASKDALTQ